MNITHYYYMHYYIPYSVLWILAEWMYHIVWQATLAVPVKLVSWLLLARWCDFFSCILQVRGFNIAVYEENSMRRHLFTHSGKNIRISPKREVSHR